MMTDTAPACFIALPSPHDGSVTLDCWQSFRAQSPFFTILTSIGINAPISMLGHRAYDPPHLSLNTAEI
jgi:hypothetical protein